MLKGTIIQLAVGLVLAACSTLAAEPMGGMMGPGMGKGMMQRHMAAIPAEYAGLTNPAPADEQSLARGAEVFAANCAACHGDGGMGDGPAAVGLDPAPAAIAHTSQMLGDDYLFWRITEGGVVFGSAMPVFGSTLDEQARWDVINYVRALGSGRAMPGAGFGGGRFDPEAELTQRAEMLAQAVEEGVITPIEAELFDEVHSALDEHRATATPEAVIGNAADVQAAMLVGLVAAGEITQEQAAAFSDVHDRLVAAGLME